MQPLLRRLGRSLRLVNYWLIARAAQIMMRILRLLPPASAFALADRTARRIGPWFGRHRVAVHNLRRAYPEKSEAEITQIASDMWGNMARLAAEYLYLDTLLTREEGQFLPANLEIDGQPYFFRMKEEAGKPHIMFTAHIGNFELLPVAAALFGLQTTVMFRPPNNPYLADYVARMRDATMEHLLPSRAGASIALARVLDAGGNVGMLVDQKLHHGGVRTSFFGRPCETSPLLAKLARQYGCDVYPARCIRLPGNRFRLILEDRLVLPRDDKGAVDIVGTSQLLNDVVERWVREDPGQWTWFHKRWNLSGPRHPARAPKAPPQPS